MQWNKGIKRKVKMKRKEKKKREEKIDNIIYISSKC